jgi:hypothetical protein
MGVTKRTTAAALKNHVTQNELQIGFVILGTMRANGVQTLTAWCLGRGWNHFRVASKRRRRQLPSHRLMV